MEGTFDIQNFVAVGRLVAHGSVELCTLTVQDGKASFDKGVSSKPDFEASFIEDLVNAHTHCGDYGLKIPEGMSLEELVAPPDGLKHRYLRGLSEDDLEHNMRSFSKASACNGSAAFIDFREGGAKGCKMLRECSEDAIILGRPISPEYDPDEMAEILSVADGIGLPSITDMPLDYIESIADDVRDSGKIFAIHASERIREDIDTILSLDPTFIVHMCEATDDDMAKCSEAEVPVVVCPTSNRYFGKESPVRRLLENGVDIALGTDNGMLCEPDMIGESHVLADVLKGQGGDSDDVWRLLSTFPSKLLNRTIRMEERISERYLTVIPETGEGTTNGCIPARPFRIKINRGVS